MSLSIRARTGLSVLGFVALTCSSARSADAQSFVPPTVVEDPTLSVDARSVFAAGTIDPGGDEILVQIRNGGESRRKGSVELSHDTMGHSRTGSAAFAVEKGNAASLHLPIVSEQATVVTVRDEGGTVRFQTTLSASNASALHVIDVSDVSRIGAALGTVSLDPEYRIQYGYGTYANASVPLLVSTCRTDPATGDVVLPRFVTGWHSVHLALIKSDVLARVTGVELEALQGYVLGGGTLAVVVTHPEDLKQPTLDALIGGEPKKTRASPVTFVPIEPSQPTSSPPRWSSFPANAADTTEVYGFAGGNLEPSAFGSNAAYGLGEVVMLGFDPTTQETASDPWIQVRIAELARRAYERNATVVFGPSSPVVRGYAYGYEDPLRLVRRELDPNQNARWAIGVATALLCLYALVAGPFAFWRARKRGKPLRALWALPIFSAVTFLVIVGVGLWSKGASSRSRRLTFVDAGAGMSRGVAHRFRGFFSGATKELTVVATDRTGVLSSEGRDPSGDTESGAELVIDHDGARLEHVASIPWQTVLVHERGLASLGAGITVTTTGNANDVIVKNRTGKPLRSVVIVLPDRSVRYVPTIADEGRIDTRGLEEKASFSTWKARLATTLRSGRTDVHPLSANWLAEALRTDDPSSGAAWLAAESTVTNSVDWFPLGVPIVLATIQGGEGRATDAGMNIDQDRMLVRVVGWGGEP